MTTTLEPATGPPGRAAAAPPADTGSLSNPDLAPTAADQRTWGLWHIASLWVGMSVCIPTYMLAAVMIDSGLTWRQSLAAIVLGNLIVWVPLAINGHAGTRYGIPFPIYARAAYGTRGAHLPSILRSLVACGWFGIQTWIGGLAIHELLAIPWPGWREIGGGATWMGYTAAHYLAFLLFWLVNLYFVWAGTESIKRLETLAAPLLIVTGLALLAWAAGRVGGLGAILRQSDALAAARPEGGVSWSVFLAWLTAMVGYWATLSLNIPDFTRYAKSQRAQAWGQAVGLLTTMPLFAFIGLAVTSATVILYGEAIWNPVDLLARLTRESGSPLLGIAAMLALALATLSTNIAANVVAPANSLSNLAPRRISFRAGGLIAAAVGVVILPWKLLDRYQAWLIGYSGLLGAVGGVILADYLLVRRTRLDLAGLYAEHGVYRYADGVNWRAVGATAAGIAAALAGKLDPHLSFLFDGAWFSATAVSFTLYALLMRRPAAAGGGSATTTLPEAT